VAAWGTEEPPVSACVKSAVDKIQKRYESVQDLSARFEQTTRSVALGRAGDSKASKGQVVFAKPGRMRWHYEEPEESLAVTDGEWLWLYDPAHREAQRVQVGEAWLSGAAIQLLLGEGDILRDFRARAEICTAEEARLVLLPREPSSYEKLVLRADLRTGDVVETEVQDLLGNVTRVRFEEPRTNTAPAPELFRFEAPEGVRVIDIEPLAP